MSCCCPYCMSELDINKIKYYVKVENEPSQPKLKAFLAVNREDRHFYNFWSRYNRKLSPETLEKRIVKSLELSLIHICLLSRTLRNHGSVI